MMRNWFSDQGKEGKDIAVEASTSLAFPFITRDAFRREDAAISRADRTGICPVCGEAATFSGFTDNLRESGICGTCGSFNRQRQMASAIRQQMGISKAGPFVFPSTFSIYNTETSGALHRQLSRHAQYTCSEYFGGEHKSGEIINGILHQDLQALSFDDESFDLILSSDVLEHMPDPYQAHREIFRVLAPGGRHIFTVPFYPWEARDEVRAKIIDGEIQYFGEKLYHGDPVRPGEGILVWTIFGLETLVRLAEIGFRPSAWSMSDPNQGILGVGQMLFEAFKPE